MYTGDHEGWYWVQAGEDAMEVAGHSLEKKYKFHIGISCLSVFA